MSSSPLSPPFLSRLWPPLVLVVAVFGVPAATIALFPRLVTGHPVLALGIGLIYEVGFIVLGFAGKAWQKLEVPLAERTATRLDHPARGILSRYRKHYADYLRSRHRDFDVKGHTPLGTCTLELNQVFVEPRIDPITPQQALPNPVQIPQALLQGSHAIWDYLASAPLSRQNLVILGPPGSGKTTLLKHVTLMLVSHWKPSYRPHQIGMPRKLPILLFLRDHAHVIKETPDFSLVDAVHDQLKNWKQPPPPAGWTKRQLTRGRCLVMLDGLDEVADPEVRQAVVDWVELQMAAYRRNRFIVTSRPFGSCSDLLSGVTVLEVRPFTAEQVEQFIHQWSLASEIMSKRKADPGARMRARVEARALLQQLRKTPALLALTVNPLLLAMIATTHRAGGKLPGNRVDLYAETCEVLLGKRQQARGQALELPPAQMQLVLETLAYRMMVEGTRDIVLGEVRTVIEEPLAHVSSQLSPEAFLQLVEQASGLLVKQENGAYSFAHLTFQEYLAASHIRERQLGHTLEARVGLTWWQETIRLYCAMADATPIINACLAGDRPSTAAVELAIACDKEAWEVQSEMRARLETLLHQGVEDVDAERQHLIAGALLAWRIRRMVHLTDEISVDTSLISCAEYQAFLDDQRARGRYLQPDHWTAYHFPLGQGHAPVLGVRPSDVAAFCAWLTEREPGPWLFRPPEAGELEKEGDSSLPGTLPAGTGYWLKDGKGFAWATEALMLPEHVLQEVARDVCIRALDLVCDLDLARPFALGRALDLDLARPLDLEYDLERIRVRPLERHLALKRHLERALERHLERARALDLARSRARTNTLVSAIILTNDQETLSSRRRLGQRFGRARKREENEVQRLIESLLDVYIDLIILENRIQGKLPACEGILLVKERK
jgi:energy-coupling factor transporter ATP-binding protein EcfA2